MARLGENAIVDTKVGSAPADYVPVEDPSVPIPEDFESGKWVYFTVSAPEDGPQANRSIWEANLVAGELRDSLGANGGPPLYSTVISVQLPSGEIVPNVAGGLGVPESDPITVSSSASETEAAIRAGASAAGLTVKSLEVLVPHALAPAVVLEAPKGWDMSQAALEPDALIRTIIGDDPLVYDGFYIEIDDASGELVAVNHAAYRAAVGTRWIRADLDPRRG